tara:strand:- start:20 stop:280 length:261 start_codon:yes stop_codon:yes gene_type:complete
MEKETQEASRKAETFSSQLMRAAFEAVQNSQDWRAPIYATICAANKELTRQAVIHFTGTVPTFKARPCKLLRVTAAGYRNGPCGDR